jgi:hypothetical protein
LLLAVLLIGASSVGAAPGAGYELLRSVKGPLELIEPVFPRMYSATVQLEGALVREFERTLAHVGLEPPRFEESMNRHGRFQLTLTNPSNGPETSEMVCGILNPVDIIQLTVDKLVRFSAADEFIRLKRETNDSVLSAGRPHESLLRIILSPRQERFCYSYVDLGTLVEESWFSGMEVLIDSTLHIVKQVRQNKIARHIDIEQLSAPRIDTLLLLYDIDYVQQGEHLLPAQLTLSQNGKRRLRVSSTYRIENGYTVFDTRTITFWQQAADSTSLTLRYGSYRFDKAPPSPPAEAVSVNTNQQIAEASKIAQRATQTLRDGKIRESVRLLQKLLNDYPQTPQAVEARDLLQCLPEIF